MGKKNKSARQNGHVVRRNGAHNPNSGRDETVVRAVTEAPVRVSPHAPAPEASKVAAALKQEVTKEQAKQDKDALFRKLKAGELATTDRGGWESLSAESIKDICKTRGWAGYSGLKKDELVEHALSGGVLYAPKDKGEKAEVLRAKCKVERKQAEKVGSDAYKGYSSQNKAGLQFMLGNGGTKPKLKDNTYSVGTVSWMQQLCRELGIAKFSGLKKNDLVAHIVKSGKDDAKALIIDAINTGKLEVGLPTLKALGIVS